MGAVRDAKGVVDIDVAKLGQGSSKSGVVLLLALLKTKVLDEQHLAVGKGQRRREGLLAAHVAHVGNGRAEQLGEAGGDRLHGVRGLKTRACGPAQVAHAHDARAALAKQVDGGKSRANAGVVAHDAVLDGHVEVDADNDTLARDVGVGDAALIRHTSSIQVVRPKGGAAVNTRIVPYGASGPQATGYRSNQTPPKSHDGPLGGANRSYNHNTGMGSDSVTVLNSPCTRPFSAWRQSLPSRAGGRNSPSRCRTRRRPSRACPRRRAPSCSRRQTGSSTSRQ